MQYNFPKMRGGVEGRLELFLEFIQFGTVIPPKETKGENEASSEEAEDQKCLSWS